MKVFVAGAAGVVGNRLVPLLAGNGFDVTAMTRSASKAAAIERAGAKHIAADGLDRDAVLRAVAAAKPDVVIHQMTALKGTGNLKEFDRDFAQTNQLRTRGTDYLIEAAKLAGAGRFIIQSYGNWNYERAGARTKSETDRLDPHPAPNQRETLAAIRYLEDAVTTQREFTGIALRYGNFYGAGTGFAPDGEIIAMVRKRQLPMVAGGTGVWSFIHVDDAAAATMAAITNGTSGIYNICDNDPAPVSIWLPYLAELVGAKPPIRLPAWFAKLMVGEVGVSMMSKIRGASNRKAKAELSWSPIYPSWRDGFRHDLKEVAPDTVNVNGAVSEV